MTDLTELYKRLTLVLLASCTFTAGACGTDSPSVQVPPGDGGGGGTPPPDPGDPAPPAPPAVFSKRASRSSTIAISDDDSHVAMVNPDDGSLSVFQTSDNSRISKTLTGPNPSSVVIAGDGKTAYVANRGDGTITRVINIDGGTPKADARVDVGAEPVGLALSPSGLKLFVAEFAEGRISVLDTQNELAILDTIPFDRPRALLVTNNGDESDDDETLVASRYYGIPVAGKEAKDDGRTGLVVTWPLTSLHTATRITLSPIDSGFPKGGTLGAATVTTSPNQLAAIAAASGRIYITSVSASPEGPTRFDNNVFPVVYVADLKAGTEVRDASGTTNIARKIRDLIGTSTPDAPRFIPGDLSDIAFLDGTQVAYAVGKAGDLMVRLKYGTGLDVGATNGPKEIDLAGDGTIGLCQAPTGLVVTKSLGSGGRGYVNCFASRRLAVVDFQKQAMTQTVEASPVGANGVAESVRRGERFFFTGRGRWSNDGFTTKTDPADPTKTVTDNQGNGAKGGEGWSSCGSCHPDGLTDNITWIFGSGPRQTTSMDGSFSHGTGAQKQRVFNWTSVNDEMHDFELNVRNVSGGLGVITTATAPRTCNNLDRTTGEQQASATIAAMGASTKDLADNATLANCGHKDWDDITAFVKTISPVHARKFSDTDSIARGKQLFLDGGCANCHGGAGWTVSNLGYTPAGGGATALATQPFAIPAFLSNFMYNDDPKGANKPRTQISNQPILPLDETGRAEPKPITILQLACSLRNVGTFGLPGTDTDSLAATELLERRAAGEDRAEGRSGYNVPSLYGLAAGAPYLHHGQAATLADLFTDPRWDTHTNAGNFNFTTIRLTQDGAIDDLSAFLLSIDASTPEIALPIADANTGKTFDACAK